MRILLDVMGGDFPPSELVKGGIAAGRQRNVDILFSGDPVQIRTALTAENEREGIALPSSQRPRR